MVTITNDFIYVSCTDTQAKKLDAIYVKSRKQYKLPNTLGALRELHKLGFNVMEYGKQKAQARDAFLFNKTSEDALLPNCKQLRPYQRVDVAYISSIPHAGIFSEMRTGK